MARTQVRVPDRERVLRPARRLCPACGGAMRIRYENRRTLVTLDRDYLDDRHFPPAESSGVLVIAAPDERGLAALAHRFTHPPGGLPVEADRVE